MSLRRHIADLAVVAVLIACAAVPVSYALAQGAGSPAAPAQPSLEQVQARNAQSLNQLEQDRAQEQIRLEAEYRNAGDAAFARYAEDLKQRTSPAVAKQRYLEELAQAQQEYEGALAALDQRIARERAELVAQEGERQAAQ